MLEDIKRHNENIRQNILKGFDDELQKAVYADTAENRKLGRVGQEYKRSKGKKEKQSKDKKFTSNKNSEKTANKKSASELRKIINSVPRYPAEGRGEAIDKIISEHKDHLADLARKAEQMAESSWSEGKALDLQNIADTLKKYAENQQSDSKKVEDKKSTSNKSSGK